MRAICPDDIARGRRKRPTVESTDGAPARSSDYWLRRSVAGIPEGNYWTFVTCPGFPAGRFVVGRE